MPGTVDRPVGLGCQRERTGIITAVQAGAVEIINALDLFAPDALVCGQRCFLVMARV
jgi:hypothetical protein